MLCKNCGKEIGRQVECNSCGFNHVLDIGNNNTQITQPEVELPQTQIKLLKTKNSMATAGLVMSIFAFYPIPFMILALIFNVKGSFRCKVHHSGAVKCVIAWLFLIVWIITYIVVGTAMIMGLMPTSN